MSFFPSPRLGFRGEALASIGSVSQMTITSRVQNEKEGARLKVEGGMTGRLTKVGATVGTTVRVEDLFYNVPARLKFLKSDVTERRAIDSLVTRYALAYPEKRFKVSDGKKVTLQTAGDGDRRAILAALYGVDVAKQMLEIHGGRGGLQSDRVYQPHFVDAFQSQGNYLLRQRSLGAGFLAHHGAVAGLSHLADGGTLSADGFLP